VIALHRSGSRVDLIAKLVQQLNARLFERAWQLIAPARPGGQQLPVRDGQRRPGRATAQDRPGQRPGPARRLRTARRPACHLRALFGGAGVFGYPNAPAASWSATRPGAAGQTLRHAAPVADGSPAATASCTWPSSWTPTRWPAMRRCWPRCSDSLHQLATDNDALLGRFAAAIDALAAHAGWWSRCFRWATKATAHLKKEGIFPLVHGVRSLALARRSVRHGTAASAYRHWWAWGQLSPGDMGEELAESLHLFMALKLKAGLAELEPARPVSGTVGPAAAQQPGPRSAQGRAGCGQALSRRCCAAFSSGTPWMGAVDMGGGDGLRPALLAGRPAARWLLYHPA
jgi:CBS domain-containing protein